jgi:hypothetical protein
MYVVFIFSLPWIFQLNDFSLEFLFQLPAKKFELIMNENQNKNQQTLADEMNFMQNRSDIISNETVVD